MVRFKNRIDIDTTLEQVFEFFSTMENLPKWNYYVKEVKLVHGYPMTVGARYHQIRKNDEQQFEIQEIIPLQLIDIKSLPGSAPQFHRRTAFQAKERRTEILDEFEVNTQFPSFLEKMKAGQIRKAVYENLYKLKELLEDGETILQDSRVVKMYD